MVIAIAGYYARRKAIILENMIASFCFIGNLLCNVPIKQKTLREDATRCMRNMSAEADLSALFLVVGIFVQSFAIK